jgi:PAS domain S-box-containing protein
MSKSPRPLNDAPEWADANCRAVLEAAPDAMLVVNRSGEIVAANQQATKLYGYSREHLIGRVVESLIPARLRDHHRQHRENFFANPETPAMQVIEIFAVLSNGSEIPVDVSLRLLTIGTETFAISAICDATERHRREGLKASAERRGRLVQKSSVAMVVAHGLEHKVELLNDKFTALLGYTIDDIPDVAHWWTLAYPDEAYRQAVRSEWETRTEKTLSDGTPFAPMEVTVRCKDGSTRHLEVHLSTIAGDTNLITFIDLTERKAAVEAMQQREMELIEAQRLAGVGSWQWEPRTDTVIWSKELYHLMGIDPTLPAPSYKEQAHLFAAESWERLQRAVQGAFQTGTSYELDLEVVRPESIAKWEVARGEPVRDKSGQIIGLRGTVQDITERKQAEARLRESEEQFRTLAEAIPQLCWMARGDGHIFWYNQRWYTYTGTTPQQMEGWGWQSVHDPQKLPLVLERWEASIATGEPFDMVFPLRAADGIFHPFLTRITPVKDPEGRVARWFGTNTDVTELRNAQEALSAMSRKLIQAQELERTRIGRELHDDIGQRLALSAIELKAFHEDPVILPEVRSRMGELQKQISDIITDIQSLSHELHSGKLQYLGIAAAMRGFCQEFGEQQKMEIDFQTHDLPSPLSPDISLCLFRVLQEAIHNAAKHSGVRHFEVRLWGTSEEIHLTVKDSGAGFDREAAKESRGLGLISMEERLKLVKGTLSINSQPNCGTTIHARAPLSPVCDSMRAAG